MFLKAVENRQGVTQLDSLEGAPERPLCEAEKVQPKLEWKPQDVGNIRAKGCSMRKNAGTKWSWPKRKAVRTTDGRGGGAGLLKPLRAQTISSGVPDAGHEATGFGVAPLGLVLD